jgi:hypothetical protein
VKGPGEPAALYYDGPPVEPGDYIRTPTGRTYLIDGVRVQERGKHAGRQHLATTVMPADHDPELDATVWMLRWYRR